MAIEHVNISDPNIHEPKGAAAAHGKSVLTADGAGGTSWNRQQMSDYAQMSIVNNATATAVTAAVDPTLNTDSDYVKVTAGWAKTHGIGITFNVDELQVAVDGHYLLHFWADVKVPANNNFIGVKVAINDTTPYSLQKLKSQSVTTNDYKNISGSAYISLSAGDTISIYTAASKTDNLTFEEAGVVLYLAHEL